MNVGVKIKSCFLLLILGISFFPFGMFCISHPLGHQHHDHNGPSACELHAKYSGSQGKHFLPPMDCEQFSATTGDFVLSHENTLSSTNLKIIVVATLFFKLQQLNSFSQSFALPPDPNCHSATLFSDSPLRVPPLV